MNELLGRCIFHAECVDVCHLWLSFLVLLLCSIALVGLILLVCYIVACIQHTAECNELAHENFRKCLDLERRLLEVERAVKRNGVRK